MATNSSNGDHQTTTKSPPLPSPLRFSKFFQVLLLSSSVYLSTHLFFWVIVNCFLVAWITLLCCFYRFSCVAVIFVPPGCCMSLSAFTHCNLIIKTVAIASFCFFPHCIFYYYKLHFPFSLFELLDLQNSAVHQKAWKFVNFDISWEIRSQRVDVVYSYYSYATQHVM